MKLIKKFNKNSNKFGFFILNKRNFSEFTKNLNNSIKERKKNNIEPSILNFEETQLLINEMKNPNIEEKNFLLNQFKNRILPGVDPSSKLKANFLFDIANNNTLCPLIDREESVKLLGTMQGGYNISALINLLSSDLQENAYNSLKNNILIFDYIYDIEKLYKKNNYYAKKLLESWRDMEWFYSKNKLPEKITLNCFKVNGEINTDDLSPAQDAWSRPDIPLHAISMLKNPREGIDPDIPFEKGPIETINWLKERKFPIAFVGDVIGTGSSRKSATNSILWHFGEDIPYVPNKKRGGFCFGNKIAPIFFNTMEDSGALPIEMPVENIKMNQIIDLYPYEGICRDHNTKTKICEWKLKSPKLLDSVRAGGRINLIIGKSLADKSYNILNNNSNKIYFNKVTNLPLLGGTESHHNPIKLNNIKKNKNNYTLAQKIIGKACGVEGILPNQYCEPIITSVGSQDTTGPMTRDELKDLACLGFTSDLVMQSFCHTAAYPKPIDIVTHVHYRNL